MSTLEDREEIRDVLFHYAHAIDRRRWELMGRIFHDDAIFQFGPVAGSCHDFIEQAKAIIEPTLSTHHQLGNILIAFDNSGDAADTETYMTAVHIIPPGYPVPEVFPPREENYSAVIAGRYVDRFEKRDGEWRIARRTGLYDWREFREIGEADLANVPQDAVGKTGGTDVSRIVTNGWRS